MPYMVDDYHFYQPTTYEMKLRPELDGIAHKDAANRLKLLLEPYGSTM